jgi:uncharacterized protein Yka (UPF0111/DUF47 family)
MDKEMKKDVLSRLDGVEKAIQKIKDILEEELGDDRLDNIAGAVEELCNRVDRIEYKVFNE